MIQYNLIKVDDVYTLFNNNNFPVQVTINYVEHCGESRQLTKFCIRGNYMKSLEIMNVLDGSYIITISEQGKEENHIVLEPIESWLNLLCEIINGVEYILCGCKQCKSCNCLETPCEEAKEYLTTIMNILAYIHIKWDVLEPFFVKLIPEFKCKFSTSVLLELRNKLFLGDTESKELFKQIISMYYIAIYADVLFSAGNEFEIKYIKEKFRIQSIFRCMKKLGIDANKLLEDVEEDTAQGITVYTYQGEGGPEYLLETFSNDDLIGRISNPFTDYTRGKVIKVNSFGNIIIAIVGTNYQNFILEDSLGNDITDDFSKEYIQNTNTAVYVSNVAYAVSNIFVKFKRPI